MDSRHHNLPSFYPMNSRERAKSKEQGDRGSFNLFCYGLTFAP